MKSWKTKLFAKYSEWSQGILGSVASEQHVGERPWTPVTPTSAGRGLRC